MVRLKIRTPLAYADPHDHFGESCKVGGKE